jgi:hypothetical protein
VTSVTNIQPSQTAQSNFIVNLTWIIQSPTSFDLSSVTQKLSYK